MDSYMFCRILPFGFCQDRCGVTEAMLGMTFNPASAATGDDMLYMSCRHGNQFTPAVCGTGKQGRRRETQQKKVTCSPSITYELGGNLPFPFPTNHPFACMNTVDCPERLLVAFTNSPFINFPDHCSYYKRGVNVRLVGTPDPPGQLLSTTFGFDTLTLNVRHNIETTFPESKPPMLKYWNIFLSAVPSHLVERHGAVYGDRVRPS